MSKRDRLSPARLAFGLLLAIGLLAIFLVGRSASAVTYVALDLATFPQGATVVVRGPNAAGTAVGGHRVAGPRRGFLLTRGGVQYHGGLSGSDYTTVFGINDVGDVVGGSNTATAARTFRSTQAGGTRELPPLAGDTASTAFALNRLGQAVGFSSGPSGEHAVLWAADGTVTALPGLSTVRASRALGLNERGDVVGVWDVGSGLRSVLWPRGAAAQDLGTLPGDGTSEAIAVNARGHVVGYSAHLTGERRATLWQPGGGILDLGTLPGGDFSRALGINDTGDVVGISTSPFGSRAFLWTSAAGLQDLNGLIAPSTFVLTQAVGINSAGAIVAIGHDATDHVDTTGHEGHENPTRVFLLLPVRP